MGMKGPKAIGFEVKVLSNLIRRRLESGTEESGCESLTGMQGWIIGYISIRGDAAVFQRDLEREFNVRRATVSGVLQLMERNGLIRREPVEYDARLKKLTLTPKAVELHEKVMQRLSDFERELRSGLTEEEIQEFLRILDKLKKNVE